MVRKKECADAGSELAHRKHNPKKVGVRKAKKAASTLGKCSGKARKKK